MKRILFLLLILSILRISAQHADLQNRIWYLGSINVAGITTDVPIDPVSFPYVFMDFFEGSTTGLIGSFNQVTLEDCEIGISGHVNYTGSDKFEFVDHTVYTTIVNCSTTQIDFMNLYMSFYEDTIAEVFNYTITDETDGSKTLLISNNNGDIVTFTDSFLVQAPEGIFQTWWYLHNLIIDGIDNIPPINEELPRIPMVFGYYPDNPTEFATQGCISFLVGDANFDIDNSFFYLYNLLVEFYGCSNNDNDIYQNLYFNFYWETIPNAYSYSYSEEGQEKTFTVTNVDGNQAIYKNWTPIDVREFEDSKITLFPNPFTDVLYIENNTETIAKIEVSNMLGEKVITKKKDFSQIDFTKNSYGVYFVKFYIGEVVFIRKVIKN